MNYRGHIENGMVVFDQPPPLPDGTPVRVEAIAPPAADFWRSTTLEELAASQGVSAPASVEELVGGWPAEELNDDFEQAFTRWREQELDPRQ
jgi:hypothetical protein